MSGFKIVSGGQLDGIDLDDLFIEEESNNNTSTGFKLADGTDIGNRYRLLTNTDFQVDDTNYITSDGKDIAELFEKSGGSLQAHIEVTASAGQPAISPNVTHSSSYTSYDKAYGAVLSFDITITTGDTLIVTKTRGGEGGTGVGTRHGSRGGNSYYITLNGNLLAVAGAGGGAGAGNGMIGASAYYEYLTKPDYYDIYASYNPNGTSWSDVEGTGNKFWFGLNARPHSVSGGDGGGNDENIQSGYNYQYSRETDEYNSTIQIDKYRNSDKGTLYNNYNSGGNGGYVDFGRRSSGGGGGGAGYIGGGGAAGLMTGDGKQGSPGGGSGSSYLNTSLATLSSLTKNGTYGNEAVTIAYTFSGSVTTTTVTEDSKTINF